MPSRLWRRWKRVAHRAAEIQSLVVLALLYWIVVVPIGFLRGRRRPGTTPPAWTTRAATGAVSVEHARRQF